MFWQNELFPNRRQFYRYPHELTSLNKFSIFWCQENLVDMPLSYTLLARSSKPMLKTQRQNFHFHGNNSETLRCWLAGLLNKSLSVFPILQYNRWRWLKAISHRDNESEVRTGEASITFLLQQQCFKCPYMITEYCPMHLYANLNFQQNSTSINGNIY